MATGVGPSAAAIATSMAGQTLTTQGLGTQIRRSVDLFGQPVAVQPHSKLSGLWTYGIPGNKWRVSNLSGGDGTASTVDGALRLTSGTVSGGITRIASKDHPRYEPDRQFGWATASSGLPTGVVKIRMGLFTTWDGFYLEWNGNDSSLKAYSRRTTGAVAPSPEDNTSGLGAATTTSTLLYTCTLPTGADPTKATLFDMWAQWRGVGDLLTLVDLGEAGITDRLGVAADIWCSNPALPFAIEVEATGAGASKAVEFGCADVTSYGSRHLGGEGDEEFDHIALPTSTVALDSTERPLIVLQAAGFLGGMACTRDHHIDRVLAITVDAAATVRIRRNAAVSNANVTWSLPEIDRGIVQGIGSNLATVTAPGTLIFDRAFATNEKIDLTELPEMLLRPIPGTLTTGANRGDPAYGETWTLTVQKTAGGAVNASCDVIVGSLY